MTPQPCLQTFAIHIWINISRRKGDQQIKFGQLIDYTMKNTFLEKSYIKCGGDTIPRTFSKKSKFNISLGQ